MSVNKKIIKRNLSIKVIIFQNLRLAYGFIQVPCLKQPARKSYSEPVETSSHSDTLFL